MNTADLDFEAPALRLQRLAARLRLAPAALRVDLSAEIAALRRKAAGALRRRWRRVDAWEVAQIARHAGRPHALQHIAALFEDFVELHGDRAGADDAAIVGGLARLGGRSMVVLGHEKGSDVKERLARNFGMPRPAGYRKCLRLMDLAERFGLPLVSLIDTPGAHPGIDAEERGQSAAIGECIYRMSQLRVPTLAVVIGEGGSGGALAIGVADVVCMLEFATYSVISPEGCASILWSDAGQAARAARSLGITAARLSALGLIDEVVPEPPGGAHRDPAAAAALLGAVLRRRLDALCQAQADARFAARQARLRACGAYIEG